MAIVTISRGSYTKGKEIAEEVARKLGYECLSRDILLEASEHFDIPEIHLVRALHDAPSVLERFNHGRERFVAFIENAFLEHVLGDNVVYHGLAGHFFLKSVGHGLKIRIIADLEDRVQLEMDRTGVDETKARQILKKDDYERRRWALALYGIDTRDPILYDIVLNVGGMAVECAVEIISRAAVTPCFETTAESQATLQNLVLASRIKVAVVEEWPTVRVSVSGGVGYVDLEAPLADQKEVRRRVEALASEVDGIHTAQVNVRPPTVG